MYIFTDSEYCIGILCKGHLPSKNRKLIEWIKHEFEIFKTQYEVKVVKVPAHSFVSGNEISDQLTVRGARKM